MKTSRLIFILGVCLSFNHHAASQDLDLELQKLKALRHALLTQEKLSKTLGETSMLHCVFGTVLSASWSSGSADFSASDDNPLVLYFYAIDPTNRKAKIKGNQDTAEISALLTESGLHFLEPTGTGNLNVTTIFPFYKSGTEDFVSVHSRHMLLPGSPLPSQSHGTCSIPK